MSRSHREPITEQCFLTIIDFSKGDCLETIKLNFLRSRMRGKKQRAIRAARPPRDVTVIRHSLPFCFHRRDVGEKPLIIGWNFSTAESARGQEGFPPSASERDERENEVQEEDESRTSVEKSAPGIDGTRLRINTGKPVPSALNQNSRQPWKI